jgi:hypothetical protein
MKDLLAALIDHASSLLPLGLLTIPCSSGVVLEFGSPPTTKPLVNDPPELLQEDAALHSHDQQEGTQFAA